MPTTMSYSKEYLKSLDLPNGYRYICRNDRVIEFQARLEADRYILVRAYASDIADGSIYDMCELHVTR